jgi:transcriptional regulator with XRE-family HTH domain
VPRMHTVGETKRWRMFVAKTSHRLRRPRRCACRCHREAGPGLLERPACRIDRADEAASRRQGCARLDHVLGLDEGVEDVLPAFDPVASEAAMAGALATSRSSVTTRVGRKRAELSGREVRITTANRRPAEGRGGDVGRGRSRTTVSGKLASVKNRKRLRVPQRCKHCRRRDQDSMKAPRIVCRNAPQHDIVHTRVRRKNARSRMTTNRKTAKRKTTSREASGATAKATRTTLAVPRAGEPALLALARQLRSWTDTVLGMAGMATDVSLAAARIVLPKRAQRQALAKAGGLLRAAREAAGLSLREVGDAIDLQDPALLTLVENGKAALPFEIILRLASVLGRHDPLSFVMHLTRAYNPDVWRALEDLGIGRLAVQAGREREFANLYRGNDAARELSDDEFAKLIAFLKAALELALPLRA